MIFANELEEDDAKFQFEECGRCPEELELCESLRDGINQFESFEWKLGRADDVTQ